MVICLERGADLHTAQLMLLPLIVCCFSKIQIGFTFLVPAHPGSPGQRAIKRVCVCVNAILMRCSGILRMTVPLEKWQQLLSFERSVKIYQIEERAVVKFLFVNTIFCKIRQ